MVECRKQEYESPETRSHPRAQHAKSIRGTKKTTRELTLLFRGLNFPVLAVATPILAKDPFLGVTDKQVPLQCHPNFTGSVPSSSNL